MNKKSWISWINRTIMYKSLKIIVKSRIYGYLGFKSWIPFLGFYHVFSESTKIYEHSDNFRAWIQEAEKVNCVQAWPQSLQKLL